MCTVGDICQYHYSSVRFLIAGSLREELHLMLNCCQTLALSGCAGCSIGTDVQDVILTAIGTVTVINIWY